jgi:2-polyprenyl-3-methyl-5-hydroxy-6-metoxy-1,4-benzoquinol methylase
MKALIFTFNDPDGAARADKLAVSMEMGVWATVVCDYAISNGFTPARLQRRVNSSLIALSDLGLGSMPHLSTRQYQMGFGDEIDFLAVNGWTYGSHDTPYPVLPIFLNTESIFYQRLRGFAARIDHLLRAIEPDLVIAPHGSETISRLITAKALNAGIPWLCSESSFFPGHLLVDPTGQHFFPGKNKIDHDWPAVSVNALTTKQTEGVTRFVQGWKTTRSTKYAQDTSSGEAKRLTAFLESREGPVLFVPMQVPVDASVHHGLGAFPSIQAFYQQLLTSLPASWRVVFKRHPKEQTGKQLLDAPDPRVLVVREVSIHDLITAADAVAVFSSNVGLEALLYGKPVIAGGKPYYGGKGLTIDVRTLEDLPAALERALTWQQDIQLRNKLVHYLLNDYLIREDDTPALLRRVEEARGRLPDTDPRRPFAECDPPACTEYVGFIRRYDELARRNLMPSDILSRIDTPEFCKLTEAERNDLGSGERQASAWVTRIEQGHLSRYALAASIIPSGLRILDLACGVGYGAYMLASRNLAKVVAVDGSKDSIDYAHANWAHPTITYRAASVGTFFDGDSEATYDVIVSFETIEHLRDADLFLDQAWRRLRPGGVLLVSTPNSDVYPHLNHPFHVEHYDALFLRKVLSQLPGIGDCQIYWQHHNVIAAEPTHNSRFLIGALFKAREGAPWVLAPEVLRAALPFTYNPPVSEFSSLNDLGKMLARRRLWLRRLLLRR